MKWQPIETVPKNGDRVIVFREGFVENMAICWYNTGTRELIPMQGVRFSEPTHWMPLPKAPKGA